MPGRPGSQPVSFEQDDILPSHQCEMVGDGSPDDSAANNNGLGMAGKRGLV